MNTNYSLLSYVLLVYILSSCDTSNQIEENGFDHICRIMTQVVTDSENDGLNEVEIHKEIDDRIFTTIHSAKALEVYNATKQVSPANKYAIFKESAEFALKREWNCKVMK